MNFQTSVRTSIRPPPEATQAPLGPQISPLRPQISPLGPQISPFRPQISPLTPQISPLRPLISPLRSKINPFRSEINPLRSKMSSQAQNQPLQPPAPRNQMPSNVAPQDVWKFTPVSYRTSALWGRCPALTSPLHLNTSSRATGTIDHVRSLDDLL